MNMQQLFSRYNYCYNNFLQLFHSTNQWIACWNELTSERKNWLMKLMSDSSNEWLVGYSCRYAFHSSTWIGLFNQMNWNSINSGSNEIAEREELIENFISFYTCRSNQTKFNFNYEMSGANAGANWFIKVNWDMRQREMNETI